MLNNTFVKFALIGAGIAAGFVVVSWVAKAV